jgi:hypothetical protein
MAIDNHQSPTAPWWPSERDKATTTDSVNVTIGTNYRSGSAIVATTQEADKQDADSAMVAIRCNKQETRVDSAIVAIDNHHRQCHGGHRGDANNKNNNNSRQCQCDHRQATTDSASVTIGTNKQEQVR